MAMMESLLRGTFVAASAACRTAASPPLAPQRRQLSSLAVASVRGCAQGRRGLSSSPRASTTQAETAGADESAGGSGAAGVVATIPGYADVTRVASVARRWEAAQFAKKARRDPPHPPMIFEWISRPEVMAAARAAAERVLGAEAAASAAGAAACQHWVGLAGGRGVGSSRAGMQLGAEMSRLCALDADFGARFGAMVGDEEQRAAHHIYIDVDRVGRLASHLGASESDDGGDHVAAATAERSLAVGLFSSYFLQNALCDRVFKSVTMHADAMAEATAPEAEGGAAWSSGEVLGQHSAQMLAVLAGDLVERKRAATGVQDARVPGLFITVQLDNADRHPTLVRTLLRSLRSLAATATVSLRNSALLGNDSVCTVLPVLTGASLNQLRDVSRWDGDGSGDGYGNSDGNSGGGGGGGGGGAVFRLHPLPQARLLAAFCRQMGIDDDSLLRPSMQRTLRDAGNLPKAWALLHDTLISRPAFLEAAVGRSPSTKDLSNVLLEAFARAFPLDRVVGDVADAVNLARRRRLRARVAGTGVVDSSGAMGEEETSGVPELSRLVRQCIVGAPASGGGLRGILPALERTGWFAFSRASEETASDGGGAAAAADDDDDQLIPHIPLAVLRAWNGTLVSAESGVVQQPFPLCYPNRIGPFRVSVGSAGFCELGTASCMMHHNALALSGEPTVPFGSLLNGAIGRPSVLGKRIALQSLHLVKCSHLLPFPRNRDTLVDSLKRLPLTEVDYTLQRSLRRSRPRVRVDFLTTHPTSLLKGGLIVQNHANQSSFDAILAYPPSEDVAASSGALPVLRPLVHLFRFDGGSKALPFSELMGHFETAVGPKIFERSVSPAQLELYTKKQATKRRGDKPDDKRRAERLKNVDRFFDDVDVFFTYVTQRPLDSFEEILSSTQAENEDSMFCLPTGVAVVSAEGLREWIPRPLSHFLDVAPRPHLADMRASAT